MTAPVHRLPLAQRVPIEVLARIFRYATYTTPRQSFRPNSSPWFTSEAVWSLPLVCRAWHVEGERALMRAALLMSAEAAKGFGDTVEARPEWAGWVRDVVVGIGDGEERLEEAEAEEASRRMVHAIEQCGRLERIDIRPLHSSVRERTFGALRAKPLKVLVFGPPLSAVADGVGWNKAGALWRLSDDFLSPSLEYLEFHGVFESETLSPPPFGPIPPTPSPHRPRPDRGRAEPPHDQTSFGPRVTHLRAPPPPLSQPRKPRRLHRAPVHGPLDRRKHPLHPRPHSHHPPLDLQLPFKKGRAFPSPTSPSPHLRRPPPPASHVPHIFPNLLRRHRPPHPPPPPPETRDTRAALVRRTGVFGGVGALLNALVDPSVEFHQFRRLVVHDVLSWWGQRNVDIVTKACKERHIDFFFYHDIEY